MIGRLCIIGVGLIGGSAARGARERGLVRSIVGVDHDRSNLDEALASGVIDRAADSLVSAVAEADLVLIAVPVGVVEAVLEALKPVWSERTVYTDTGSTKSNVVEAAGRVFGGIPPNFVPGHPIAGAERSGVTAARADLYAGKRVILTPLRSTDAGALAQVGNLWKNLGAQVSHMEPRHHDRILAATSHLPHVLAFVLTEMLGRQDREEEIFKYAAGGFRDFTRIASSDPKMWLDICLANGREIVPLIEQYREALKQAADLIESGSAEELRTLFANARGARQRFLDQMETSAHAR